MVYLVLRFSRLNPYFFGKCSTARMQEDVDMWRWDSLNPYFFGKCSTALYDAYIDGIKLDVLILIFLENALRPAFENPICGQSRS